MADYKKDRKQYLINFHTSKDIDQSVFSGNTSRTNSDFEQAVEYGEIVVQHNSDEAALFVRRNGANFAKFVEERVVDEKIENAVTGASSSVTSALTAMIEAEEDRAKQAENTINSALTAETSARTAADQVLQNNIDALESALTSGLSAEIAARASGDTALENKINAMNSTTSTGDSKVVTSVTQSSGAVTTEAANLSGVKLDGYVVSADTTDIAATDTLGKALGKLQAQINVMDKSASAETGKIVTTVSEEDGVVSETKALIKDVTLSGYTNNTGNTGAITTADTIEVALNRLENALDSQGIVSNDNSIEIASSATETNIGVNIKTGEHVLAKNGANGIYTDIDLVKITTGLPETIKERYQLLGTDDSQLGVNIDIPKDSHIVSIEYDHNTQSLIYTYINVSGDTSAVTIDLSEMVIEAEFVSGVTSENHLVHGVVDPTSEKVVTEYDASGNTASSATVLTVGTNGFKVDNIQTAINAKVAAEINKLDKTDTGSTAQFVSAVTEENGIITTHKANVSNATLTGYTKGSDATAVADNDTINAAISKLENQIDKAADASKTEVVGSGLTHITLTSSTETDGHIKYTIGETDIASDSALSDEIAARKAVDGINGDTYTANTGTHYISGATSLNNADVLLDTALNNLDGKAVTGVTVNGEVATVSANVATVTIDGTDINVGADVVKSAITYLSSADTVAEAFDLIFTEVLDNEITTSQALLELNSGLSAETAARTAADNALDARVDALEEDARTSINLLEVSGITGVNVTYSSAGTVNTVTVDFSNAVIDGGSF